MRKIIVLFLACVVLALFANGQQTGPAVAMGACSVAISGSGNTVPIVKILSDRCGLAQGQMDKIVSLLNTVFTKRDSSQINAKLNELIKLASKPSEIENNQTSADASQNGTDNQQGVQGGTGNTQTQIGSGGQSVGQVHCDNAGNCAGINNGQQFSTQIGEPSTIKQIVAVVDTTCILADPSRVPEDVVMSQGSENSYIGGPSSNEIMTDGAYTFTKSTEDGSVVATQKFSLEPTSSLIGSPTSSLYRGYNLLHIVDYSVAGGYFKKCTNVAVTLKVNGNDVMHIDKPVAAEMDNIHGLSFSIGLTPH